MCVITYKPANVTISETDLYQMWQANRDGAGLAFFEGEKVVVKKGFMIYEDLLSFVNKHQNKELVIHFRLATHGAITEELTHPFYVSSNIDRIVSLENEANLNSILFHNGIISGYGYHDISDTAHFISEVYSRIPKKDTRVAVLKLTGCKYVLMDRTGISFVGEFSEYKGLKVSNTYWSWSRAKNTYSGTGWKSYSTYLENNGSLVQYTSPKTKFFDYEDNSDFEYVLDSKTQKWEKRKNKS